MKRSHSAILIALSIAASAAAPRAEDSAWVSIFNGKNLEGWTPYFQKGPGNPDSTWQATPEGYLKVNIHLPFSQTGYGHLFYTKKKLSYYMIRTRYKFTIDGYGYNDWAQGWNRQNNGIMLHSQAPSTMNGKDFPTSIEVQLLGPKNEQNPEQKSAGFKYATTLNLCTPSTYVAYNGTDKYTQHCTAAKYPAAWKNTEIPWDDPDGWSDATVRVLGDSLVQHFIHGEKVFEYTKLRNDDGTPLKDGYISLQAEGTPTLFDSIEVLELTGCMDNASPAYRSYFVKSDPAACNATSLGKSIAAGDAPVLAREGALLAVRGEGAAIAEVRRIDGSRMAVADGARSFAPDRAGIYMVWVRTPAGLAVRRAAWY